jgi:MFS family permease
MLFNLITWGPYLVLGPILARQYLGGARAWGIILAAYGAGSVAGGLLALGRRPHRPVLAGAVATFGYCLPPLLLAVHAPLAAVAGGALIGGAGSALGQAFESTAIQQQVPAEAMARVSAIEVFGAFLLGPLAFAATGPVAAVFGARAVLAFAAAWSALVTTAVLTVPSVRAVTWPSAVSPPARPHRNVTNPP